MYVNKLLNEARELKLIEFLAARAQQATVLAPPPVLDAMRAAVPAPVCTLLSAEDALTPAPGNIFAFDAGDENALLARIRRRFPQRNLFGIQQDVLPALATATPLFGDYPLESYRAARKYAIVCGPRSGSTYLCDLLIHQGAGLPREHIRQAMADMLRHGAADAGAVLHNLWRRATRRGFCATKLVWHYLLDAFGEAGLPGFFQGLEREGWQLVFLTRSNIPQAVSRFVARRSGLWHVWGELREADRQRFEQVPYDFAAIREELRLLERHGEMMRGLVDALPAGRTLHVRYEELEADTHAVMERIAAHVGLAGYRKPQQPVHAPRKVSAEVPYLVSLAERFRRDLQ